MKTFLILRDARLSKRRSQEFSDASVLGDGGAIAHFVYGLVTFMLATDFRSVAFGSEI